MINKTEQLNTTTNTGITVNFRTKYPLHFAYYYFFRVNKKM